MGFLADFIRDKRIPLEMSLSSSIDIDAAAGFDDHPFIIFYRNNFRVTFCSDNRLMGAIRILRKRRS